jgi:glycosyltransferase involved in cell wall biosynthesis
LRVLVVEPDLRDNGALRVTLDRADRWRRAGAEVTVVVAEDLSRSDAAMCKPDGLRYLVPAEGTPRLLAVLLSAWRALRIARRSDVVVAGREIDSGLLVAAAVAVATRRPLAVTVQSNVERAIEHYVPAWLQWLSVHALKRANLLVCVSAGLLPGLRRIGLSDHRMVVVRNGIDIGRVTTQAAEQTDTTAFGKTFVASSGRLVRQKGFDLLVRAHAAALRAGAPHHSVVILGEGPERRALERLADYLGVSDTVHLLGHVPNPHAVVARAAAFVLPSRWEGYPLVLAESVSLGVPTLAFDCVAGPSDALSHGAFGLLLPAGDVSSLAGALLTHLVEPGDLCARASAGKASAHSRFDPDAAAAAHLRALERLVDERVQRVERDGNCPQIRKKLEGCCAPAIKFWVPQRWGWLGQGGVRRL